MKYCIGLDVSLKNTTICVVDQDGKTVAEGKSLTLPSDICNWIASKNVEISSIVKVGLEAGSMSNWLFAELTKLGLPMICLETFQAHQFLKTCRNKTDKNDARGLAQLVRMGGDLIRPVIIRGWASQEDRMLLIMRQQLVQQKVGLENNITGSLKPFGLVVPRGSAGVKTFRGRVMAALDKAQELGFALHDRVVPSLDLYEELCKQLDILTRRAQVMASKNPVCRRLMTAPGVGPIVALSFVTAIDNPLRFSKGADIGAYFGLTPKQYQSGETDFRVGISKCGDTMTRMHLVQTATILLSASKKWSALKAWGIKIAKRRGFNKARIAVARKLAIILHRMWIHDQDFRWTDKSAGKELTDTALI